MNFFGCIRELSLLGKLLFLKLERYVYVERYNY